MQLVIKSMKIIGNQKKKSNNISNILVEKTANGLTNYGKNRFYLLDFMVSLYYHKVYKFWAIKK